MGRARSPCFCRGEGAGCCCRPRAQGREKKGEERKKNAEKKEAREQTKGTGGFSEAAHIDLRGAVLDTATLYFAHIVDSQWEGADLTGFGFGYATLSGSMDEHTVWPEGPCSVDGSTLACSW